GQAEILKYAVQVVDLVLFECRQLGETVLAKRYEILDLDEYAIPDQGVFAEVIAEFRGLLRVTAVDGRYGCQHGMLFMSRSPGWWKDANLRKPDNADLQRHRREVHLHHNSTP